VSLVAEAEKESRASLELTHNSLLPLFLSLLNSSPSSQ
jgi:hypothetical protein